ncbi:MAG: peptidase M64 [Bacteroidales bacterium]|nr:peptidase M64 [Bacteroidales bacterium]
MKNLLTILLSLVSVAVFAQFDKYFENRTMRVDYYHAGDSKNDYYYIDEVIAEPYWGGSLVNLIDDTNFGKYLVKVLDKASGTLIYSRSYSTLFGEWQTVDEARTVQKSFSESVVFPYPKAAVTVVFCTKAFETGKYVEKYRYDINPDDVCLIKHDNRNKYPVYEVHKGGDANRKVDIVIVPDGYTASQMSQFKKDCEKFKNEFFKYEPYTSHKNDFNIHAVLAPSQESGVDEPCKGIWKNTIVSCSYWSLGSERYLMTTDNKTLRDVAANAPYDQIYILVNSTKYGGGGIFNWYCTGVNSNKMAGKIIVHEFGHGFAGLGDEYVGGSEYNDFYNLKLEPADPNVTTLVDFDSKWKDMVEQGTPVPTPATSEYNDKVGVYEGAGYLRKGLYRPMQDCLMNHFGCDAFCPVCQRAIVKMIEFYCK